jgi:hypothetical protein
MKATSIVTLAAFAFSCTPALAWNDFGHMQVAAVAWAKLTQAERDRIVLLLKKNPKYDKWIEHVAPEDRDQVAFLMAARWPDAIKHDHDYISDGTDNGDRPPPGPEASQNIGYVDHLRHKYWHFVDKGFSPDNTHVIDPPPKPNAGTQIAPLRAKLSDPTADPDIRSYDLVWLLHLVGDVHQPLHATARFIATQTEGDAGGNKVEIQCGDGCSAAELHMFWDDVLGTSEHPQEAIDAAAQLPPADPQLAAIADERKWLDESFKLAQTDVYVGPIGVGTGPFDLTDDYKANALSVAQKRIALAGARLANLLKQAVR